MFILLSFSKRTGANRKLSTVLLPLGRKGEQGSLEPCADAHGTDWNREGLSRKGPFHVAGTHTNSPLQGSPKCAPVILEHIQAVYTASGLHGFGLS